MPTIPISTQLKQVVKWLDKHLLLLLSGFLIAFIPLFPKIPFFSPIEQYIVRVRLEDIFVLLTAMVWLVQVIRKKVRWRHALVWFIVAYVMESLLSVLSALFIIKTVPLQWLHVAKTVLHFFRYIEYFSLLFIVWSSIQRPKDVKFLLGVITLTVIAISIYGYGQKYWYWPVYSTMNREFSKGVRLYLTEHARVQSTFAGHYDLAAYLVIVLPLILAIAYVTKHKLAKSLLTISYVLGTWLLVLSASRTSFIAFILGIAVTVVLFALQQPNWLKKIRWGVSRSAVQGLLVLVLILGFGGDMYERFLQLLAAYPQLNNTYHQLNKTRKDLVQTYLPFVDRPQGEPPPNSLSTEQAAVIVTSDERPTSIRPIDVYKDIPDRILVATESADGTTSTIVIEQPRTWSDNALKHGLSLAIRLDTLWPQAIKGFWRNPLLGSGYATLNKQRVDQFTEADSTDNNFLRTLGETGLLGFVTFYGLIVAAMVLAAKQFYHRDSLLRALSLGYLGASVGLLLNALYIDVYAASKVAFVFWAVTGLLLGYISISQTNAKSKI